MPAQDEFLALRDSLASAVEPALAASTVRKRDGEYDVVVVGFGVAGASAALEAAEQGLRVLLIERFQGGGSSQQSGGIVYAGGGTPVQTECGVEDSPEAMADYLRLEVGGVLSDETVARFCRESVDTLEFLTRHGVYFSGPRAPKKTSYPTDEYYLYYSDNGTVPAFRGAHPPAERGHRTKNPALIPGARRPPGQKPHGGFSEGADAGWYLMAALKQAVAEESGISVLVQTRAHRLVRDGSGRVVGVDARQLPPGSAAAALHRWAEAKANKLTLQVLGLAKPFARLFRVAEQVGAKPRAFAARRGVILAAGGYVRNAAMMARYAAPYLKALPIGCFGDDGAGLRLGVSVGGVGDHLDKISAWRFINPPYDWTKGVIVGASGERLTNEELYGAHLSRAIYGKSDGRAWLIVDQATWDAALEEVRSGKLFAFQQFPVNQARKSAKRANSIEELATKLGVDAVAMRRDIEAYSSAARSGAPDPMGKSDGCRAPFGAGPYYAISLTHELPTNPITALSTGGLRVDEQTGAVVDLQGGAIGGLYAAGRNAIGVASNNYVSGLSLADGVWSGRRAARAIASHAVRPRGADAPAASTTVMQAQARA